MYTLVLDFEWNHVSYGHYCIGIRYKQISAKKTNYFKLHAIKNMVITNRTQSSG